MAHGTQDILSDEFVEKFREVLRAVTTHDDGFFVLRGANFGAEVFDDGGAGDA